MFRELIAASGLLIMQPCERPPIEHQGPTPPAVIIFADPLTVDTVCREAANLKADPRQILACTNAERRVMLMPDPCLYEGAYPALLCHERSHLPRLDGSPGWEH